MADETTEIANKRAADMKLIGGYKIRGKTENPDVVRVVAELQESGSRYSTEPFKRIDPSTKPGINYWGNEWNNWSGLRPTGSHSNAVDGEIGYSIRILENGKPKKPESRYAVFDSANSFFTAKARTFLGYEAKTKDKPASEQRSFFEWQGYQFLSSEID